jgi:hypothetical protein
MAQSQIQKLNSHKKSTDFLDSRSESTFETHRTMPIKVETSTQTESNSSETSELSKLRSKLKALEDEKRETFEVLSKAC